MTRYVVWMLWSTPLGLTTKRWIDSLARAFDACHRLLAGHALDGSRNVWHSSTQGPMPTDSISLQGAYMFRKIPLVMAGTVMVIVVTASLTGQERTVPTTWARFAVETADPNAVFNRWKYQPFFIKDRQSNGCWLFLQPTDAGADHHSMVAPAPAEACK